MGTIPESWWSKETVAVVTGANKGIGYEIVRLLAENGLTVVLTARDPAKGKAAIEALKAQGLQSVVFHPLEVSSPESVQTLATWLKSEYGGIDILVNNAGFLEGEPVLYLAAKQTIETNYYGVKNVTKGLLPLLRASPAGARVVNVSSRLGLYDRLAGESLKEKLRDEERYSVEFADSLATNYLEEVKAGGANEKGWPWIPAGKSPMYSESKIFLNVYAAALAKSLLQSQPENHQILVVTFCPGVTQTDMFASAVKKGLAPPEAFPIKSVADGADTGVWLALLPKEELVGKAGKFFGERAEYDFGWPNPPL